MAQQAVNFLIKQGQKALQGKDRSKVDGVFSYLNNIREFASGKKCSASQPEHFMNLDVIEEALKVNICMKISSLLKKAKNTANQASRKDFINSLNALEIIDMSQCHIRYVTFMFFRERLGIMKDANGKAILTKLCMLYGLDQLHKNNTGCYDSGYFHGQTKTPFSELILEAIKEINRQIRPYAIPLVESLGFTDETVVSAIGNSYGDIYEQHLEWAKESRLNKTKDGDAIPDGYLKYMSPVIQHKM